MGAHSEASAATGINGDQTSNAAAGSGAVYVFTRTGTTWSQQAYVKASNTGANDLFGCSVALSADGSTLAVGAYGEDSAATGINGDQTSNAAADSGAVYVFTRTGTTWSQQAYVKASNTGAGDYFGISVALSADGSTLAVGALHEDSAATGINGDQTSNAAASSGAVYVFTRTGTTWSQQAYVKASNTGARRLLRRQRRAVGRRLDPGGGRPLGGQRGDRHQRRPDQQCRRGTPARSTCSRAPARRGASRRTSRRPTPAIY